MKIDWTRTKWKELIQIQFKKHNESWSDVIHSTLTEEELNRTFDCSMGSVEGVSFTLWTTNRVYFPVKYDGSEWCESVSRNPCDERTSHLGGG